MSPAQVPYAIDFTDSNVGSYDVSGGGNRLEVNGNRRSGSGRVAAAAKLDQPGAPPLAPSPPRAARRPPRPAGTATGRRPPGRPGRPRPPPISTASRRWTPPTWSPRATTTARGSSA
ncbi:MAG: hypothetical protein ACJ782_21165 [Actinomycetota bacterium]